MKQRVFKVGLLGCGNIGSTVARELLSNKYPNLKFQKALVKDLSKDRGIPKEYLTSEPNELLENPEIDLVVEVMSGEQPALDFVLKALNNKKHVVSANKELLAKFGKEIFETAEKNSVQVRLDATVGGGIPIINTLLDSLGANEINEVVGILNGTTNYILSEMKEGKSFKAALEDATQKGYAEPDPTNDLEGYDTKYKTAILASLSFKKFFSPEDVYCDGIKNISSADFHFAKKWGFAIKLLGIAKKPNSSHLDFSLGVYPSLISSKHQLAQIDGVTNAATIKGHLVNEIMLVGPGAGPEPTTSAILGDVLSIVKNVEAQLPSPYLEDGKIGDSTNSYRFYVRLRLGDQKGAMAEIGNILAKNDVSLELIDQESHASNRDWEEEGEATFALLTHSVCEKEFELAIEELKKADIVKKVCCVMRVFE